MVEIPYARFHIKMWAHFVNFDIIPLYAKVRDLNFFVIKVEFFLLVF